MELERAKEAIKRTDNAYLERRAERFSELEEMRDFSEIQEPVKGLLLDAYFSYAYLYYAGCVLLSTTALEHTLRIMLAKLNKGYQNRNFVCLIDLAKECGLINDQQAIIAHEIRKLRNVYVHYDIKELRKISKDLIDVKLIAEGVEIHEMYSKDLIEQLQLEVASPKIALKCLSKCYELILSLYKNYGHNVKPILPARLSLF